MKQRLTIVKWFGAKAWHEYGVYSVTTLAQLGCDDRLLREPGLTGLFLTQGDPKPQVVFDTLDEARTYVSNVVAAEGSVHVPNPALPGATP